MRSLIQLTVLLLAASPLRAQTPAVITLDRPATGTLSDDDPTLGDESHYDLWVLRADAGRRIRLLLTSAEFDTYLSVGTMDAGSFEATADNDDYDPPGTDSRLDATVPASGVLYIRVNSFSAGETGTYTLSATPAPNAAVGGVRPIAAATVSGAEFIDGEPYTRNGAAPAHFWRFDAVAGERYAIVMYSTDVDCYLSIGQGVGEEFESIMDVDDVDGGTDSRIIYEPEESGPVIIRASAFGADTGTYRLAIQRLPAAME